MRLPSLLATSLALSTAIPALAGDDFFTIGGGLNLADFRLDPPSGMEEPDHGIRFAPSFQVGYEAATAGNNATLVTLGYESRGSVQTLTNDVGETADLTMKLETCSRP